MSKLINPVRHQSIINIIDELKSRCINLSEFTALDFFARDGSWQAQYYAPLVKQVYAWEIDPVYKNCLKKNLPANAVIQIGILLI